MTGDHTNGSLKTNSDTAELKDENEKEVSNADEEIEEETDEARREEEEDKQKKQALLDYIDELVKKDKRRQDERAKNINVKRPEESYFSKLDSNLKKNTAFVRKVKNFSSAQLNGLLNDLKVLNLSKYITEIASAMTEAKLKVADILPACELCCALHRLYADFENALLECWKKSLTIKSDEPVANNLKYKIDLKLYAELVLLGLWAVPPPSRGLQLLGSIIISLVHNQREDFSNISPILSFCRSFGEVYAGLVPREMAEASKKFGIAIPCMTIIPSEKHKTVRQVFQDYYDSFCKHLIKNHNELQKFEKQSRTILQTKGELSANRKAEYNDLLTEYRKLLDYARQFSEILNVPMPVLPVEEVAKSETTVIDELLLSHDERFPLGIWEDEETQRFYESLSDLHVFLPQLPIDAAKQKRPSISEISEEILDEEIELPAEEVEEEKKVELEHEVEAVGDTKTKYIFNDFLVHLPSCCNRDTVDNMAIEFVLNLNTKHNQKKLAKYLFGVNRTRLDLLPFYSRLVATIHPVAPDVATDLCQMLKQDFLYHVRKKDQINIESKIKVVRFIGELIKFKMYSKLEGLFCIKVLLQNFNHHHHVEMVCNLFETCGRFLFNHPESRQRTKVYLEQMMRKKSVMALDSRYATMTENAFYAVIPREGGQTVKKERPPIHEFIRQILYHELSRQNVSMVIKLLNKVDWNDPDISAYVVKCLVNAWNVKYFNIKTLAGLVADISRHYERIQIEVVDGVLEDIRLGLEVMQPKYNQRRIAMVKYLGELYYYRMADSCDILKVLYLLISLGVTFSYTNVSPLDPPGHTFRLSLVCVLLETCGHDPYWSAENPFPPRLRHMVRDCLLSVRPKMIIFHDYAESQEAVEELKKHFMSKVETDVNPAPSNVGELNPIEEKEEVEFVEGNDDEIDDEERDSSDEESQTFEGGNPSSQSQGEEIPIISESNESENSSKVQCLQKVKCQEDEDFMNAFDKLVADQIQDRMRERITPQQIDIAVPLHVHANTKKTYEQLKETTEETSTVNFILMIRKGNKHSYKSLNVPIMSELAINLKEQEMLERMEKEKVKKLTLDINERLEEEDYQDMMNQSQRPTVSNLNRERRQKYQHPKGAPDVDLIFGTSKGK
ncbi:hypothetical protein RUM43_001503 [Polyplax serrata]|uniref:MIF4G domain-containing protein n=1 Tax=Polyplax serrata TaxID=468196 RepID=A0AAN8SEF9_POLSC